MDRRVATTATLVVLALAGLATAAPGFGPGASETTPAVVPSDGSSSEGSAASAGTDPFRLKLLAIEECGTTCRDVRLRLYNQQAEPAEEVTVAARIHAGNGTDGPQLWENDRELGTIDASGSVTSTERVTLGLTDVARLEASGGWVTVYVRVSSAGESIELTRQEHVR